MRKGKLILLLMLVLPGIRINQSFAQTQKRPLTMKEIQPIQNALQLVHNQKLLHLYDLFGSRNNKHLQFAFLTAPGEVRIFPVNSQLAEAVSELRLARFDYAKYDKNTGTFALLDEKIANAQQKENEIIIRIDDFIEGSNYILLFRDERCPVILDPAIGGIIDTFYNASGETDFGVRLKGDSAVFKLWSPPAGRIELLLFNPDGSSIETTTPIELQRHEKGVWSLVLTPEQINQRSIEGLLYQYRVFAYGKSSVALDPYAFSMGAFDPMGIDKIGKGAIISMDSEQSKQPNFHRNYSNTEAMSGDNDLIVWEMNVRDFTSQPGAVNPKYAGTYIGFAQKAPYIKDLGVTHVQLMPVMNFYTVNEQERKFSGKEATSVNYNWGYDPHNYFTPEGWYSVDPANPYARIAELRSLVYNLHELGVGVILDVVYNHTYIVETFENVAPGCYYRFDENLKISGHTGAGPSIESRRPMVRNLIIESLVHFIKEYHVDGFRFDLMSFLDHETMKQIKMKVGAAYDSQNPDALILLGEAWMFSDLDISVSAEGSNAAVTKLNYPSSLKNIGVFNDVARDAIVGKFGVPGFILGESHWTNSTATVIVGGVKGYKPGLAAFNNEIFYNPYNLFANTSANCLNFLSVHDGMALWDKFNLMMPGVSSEEKAKTMRMASLMLFTSCGKIIIHGGDELLRSKPASDNDPEHDRIFSANGVSPEDGVVRFHENSYASADFTNMFRWHKMSGEEHVLAQQMHEYYRGLIIMRRSIPAFTSDPCGENGSNLKFIGSGENIQAEIPAVYNSFADSKLSALTIRFVNGPADETYYMAGEIHRSGVRDNPVENPFVVRFNYDGVGEIRFDEQQIRQFDLKKWGNPQRLDIKLVKHMGAWETIQGAYSATGNNSIDALMIDKNGFVNIDLSQQDFAAVPPILDSEPWIAYIMDNNPTQKSSPGFENALFDKIVVVHNPSDRVAEVPVEEIHEVNQWGVIADQNHAGVTILTSGKKKTEMQTTVIIKKGKIIVQAKSSAVVVRKMQ